jgi:hypothetical protein
VDTEVEVPEQAPGEDDAVWSRAWEWPGWLATLGGVWSRVRRWRPDGRTLGVMLALFYLPILAQAIPIAKPAWEALRQTAPPGFGAQPQITWERVYAGAQLGSLLGSALVVLAAVLLVVLPRRLPGYIVAVAGLVAALGTSVALMLVAFHLVEPREFRVGYVANVVAAALLLGFVLHATIGPRE